MEKLNFYEQEPSMGLEEGVVGGETSLPTTQAELRATQAQTYKDGKFHPSRVDMPQPLRVDLQKLIEAQPEEGGELDG